jgi:hypothetical protein
MRQSNRDIEREALELEQERVVHEFFEFDFIGDDLFSIGVPALSPPQFKKMVFGAAKTYLVGNASIDYTIRTYGENWDFEPLKRGYYSLYRDMCYFVTSMLIEMCSDFSRFERRTITMVFLPRVVRCFGSKLHFASLVFCCGNMRGSNWHAF